MSERPTDTNVEANAALAIRLEMARQNLNATKLADLIGVSDMWVGRRLRNDTKITLCDFARIADALEVSIEQLISASRELDAAVPEPEPAAA